MSSMTAQLEDLVARMTRIEEGVNSAESVSWHAHREAEALTDETYIDQAEELLARSNTTSRRSALYFVLGCLGKNLGSRRCKDLLVSLSAGEHDKYALSSLLDSLSKSPLPIDLPLESIYRLLKDKRWLVQHSAIRALGQSSALDSEQHLLLLLSDTNDEYAISYCHSALGKIGTPAAIPQIEANLASKKRDVKHSAQAAIDAIKGRHGVQ